MAKKKRQKIKKRKRHQQAKVLTASILQQNIADLVELLHQVMVPGRSRRAVSTAKLLLKHPDFNDEIIPEVVAAYRFRVDELFNSGRQKDIVAVVDSYKLHNLPGELLSDDMRVRISFQEPRACAELLENYATDAQLRDNIDRFIRRELDSLEQLAQNRAIPNDNVVKQQAELLLNAWQEVESAAGAGENFAAMLQQIKRRSPFIAWRLFIVGLNHFYHNEDARALDCFSRIAADSPLYKVAQAMQQHSGGKAADTVVSDDLFGELNKAFYQSEILTLLRHFDAAFAKRNFDIYEINRILGRLSKLVDRDNNPLFYRILSDCAFRNQSLYDDFDYDLWSYLVNRRLNAELAYALYTNDAEDWEIYSGVALEHSELEYALILDRLGQLAAEELEDEEYGYDLFSFLHGIGKKSKQEKVKIFKSNSSSYWERSINYYPLVSTYENWYKYATKYLSASKSDKILERWHKDFPDDTLVLFKLVASCCERGAYSKAEKYLLQIDNSDTRGEEFMFLEQQLYLGMASKYLQGGKLKQLLCTLTKIPKVDQPFYRAYRLILQLGYLYRILQDGEEKEIAMHKQWQMLLPQEVQQIKELKCQFICYAIAMNLLDIDIFGKDFIAYVTGPINADELFSSLHILLNVPVKNWRKKLVAALPMAAYNIQFDSPLTTSSEVMVKCYYQLKEYPEILYGLKPFFWELSRVGMERNDRYLPDFLLVRAFVLARLKIGVEYIARRFIEARIVDILTVVKNMADAGNDDRLKYKVGHEMENIVNHYMRDYYVEDIVIAAGNLSAEKIESIIKREVGSSIRAIIKLPDQG